MVGERITLFIGGIFIGDKQINLAIISFILTAIIHFVEYEFEYRLTKAVIGEEVEEHSNEHECYDRLAEMEERERELNEKWKKRMEDY